MEGKDADEVTGEIFDGSCEMFRERRDVKTDEFVTLGAGEGEGEEGDHDDVASCEKEPEEDTNGTAAVINGPNAIRQYDLDDHDLRRFWK